MAVPTTKSLTEGKPKASTTGARTCTGNGPTVKRFFSACSNRYTKGLRGPELLKPTITYYKKKYEIPDPQFDVNKDPEEQMKAK